ncbi:MAG: glycosyltransferase family 4 protein [Bacteroidales bacterium]
MRILQLTNKPPYPARDGGSIATLSLATGLATEGHTVTVLAMNTSKHFVEGARQEPGNPGAPYPNIPLTIELVPVDTGIRWHKALANLLFSRLPYNGQRFLSDTYRQRLRELLGKERFDAIILENLYTALYLGDIEELSDALVVMRAHNVEHEIWERTAAAARGVKRIYLTGLSRRIRRFELSLINRYDALVPITHRDASHFKQFGNTKPVHVLQTGIDILPSGQEESPGLPTVAHLGALDWIPNRDGIRWFLGQVWPVVIKEFPQARFHLAGRNAPDGFADEMRAGGVVFHGEIEDADRFIRSYPLFIVPLFSGSGMRIKLLQYLAAGRAVVSTPIGAEGIPVNSGRELLIADQPGDFARSILELLGDPERCREIGKNAVTFVEQNFDNETLIRAFTQFLTRLNNGGEDHTRD